MIERPDRLQIRDEGPPLAPDEIEIFALMSETGLIGAMDLELLLDRLIDRGTGR